MEGARMNSNGGPSLVITLRPDGTVNVQGPLDNKILCFGLLEIARQVVHSHTPRRVVVPSPVVPEDLQGTQG